MPLKRTPEYMNDLILSGARYQGGPAITNNSGLAAGHRVKQARGEAFVEGAGGRLNLSREKLDEGGRQFKARYGLARDDLDFQKKDNAAATKIASAGLGLSIAGNISETKRSAERIKAKEDMIKKYEAAGDEDSLFIADFIRSVF